MCTRRENLKRHFKRLHHGQGKPILQYISGNSIVTPEESTDTIVFPDEYSTGYPSPEVPIVPLDPLFLNIKKMFNLDDKLFWPIYKPIQLQSEINSYKHSWNQTQAPYFSQPYTQHPTSFRSINPMYYGPETTSNQHDNIPRTYDGVSGFKVDICLSCLTTLWMPMGSKDLSLQEIHKCTSGMEDAIKILGSDQYAHDLERKLNQFPELLFNKCKEWANGTSGLIYLTATKTDESDKSETQKENTLVDYDSLSFLKRVLSESKIKLTDVELLEFLELVINQTKTIITLRGKPGQANLKYTLEVSIT